MDRLSSSSKVSFVVPSDGWVRADETLRAVLLIEVERRSGAAHSSLSSPIPLLLGGENDLFDELPLTDE